MNPFKYINSLSLFGKEGGYMPGLARIKKLLNYLGNPEEDLNIIHLAGTNGKGSTAAFIENIYRKAGYKTGLFTSPHFFHFNERIKINGRAASTYEFEEMIEEVRSAAEKLNQERKYGEASFFEIITALAFLYFKRHQAELVILETGLGGRLDATNVVQNPLLSIITNISLEHTNLLGNTTVEIAEEKAGIIKENSKVLTAVIDKDALKVIKQKAKSQSASLYILEEEFAEIANCSNLDKNHLYLRKKYSYIKKESQSYEISLLGRHQAVNAALALKTVELLQQNFKVGQNDIKAGLASTYWPGRMQKLGEKPLIIIDAAHNPAAFEELAASINTAENDFSKINFVFSALNDKNIEKMLESLKIFEADLKLYLAENSSFRTAALDRLIQAAEKLNFKYESYDDLSKAAEQALGHSSEQDLIIAAGSIYTVFESGITFITKRLRGGKNG